MRNTIGMHAQSRDIINILATQRNTKENIDRIVKLMDFVTQLQRDCSTYTVKNFCKITKIFQSSIFFTYIKKFL